MTLIEKLQATFFQTFHRETAVIVRAPGRINLLGAHVDYSEGLVLPATIDQAVWLAAAPTNDKIVTIQTVDFNEKGQFNLPSLRVNASSVVGPWLNYPMGMAWALQEAGHDLPGMDVLLVSDLPMDAGLSSSAAVEMAFGLAWNVLAELALEQQTLAGMGQKCENEYLGVGSGLMDQFACLHGVADQFVFLDCRTMAHELVPLPEAAKTAVLLADSGVRRRLVKDIYNIRPAECLEATQILQEPLPHIQTLRDVTEDELELYGHLLPIHLRLRAAHVVGECQRVRKGVEALKQNDLDQFGRLIRQSHISSRDNYDSSIPELDCLASAAWQTPGCIGARFSGGGRGGMMQVLVYETAASAVQSAMAATFEAQFNRHPPMLMTKISDGARVVMLS